jgi:protein required for attachment to host cells
MDLKIPHDALAFVGDGRRALFLRNNGDAKFPNLKTEKVFVDENPPSHDQGTEQQGIADRRQKHRRANRLART